MERVGVRELRQHASRYLQRVQAGETLEVTVRGDLVALLVPAEPARSEREALVAAGRLIPASQPLKLGNRHPAKPGHPTTDAALDELRADRG